MKLSIHSLQKTLYDGEVEKIIARTTSGEITVLEGHIPLISSLVGPWLQIIDKKGKESVIAVESGFIEVRPENEVVVLTN